MKWNQCIFCVVATLFLGLGQVFATTSDSSLGAITQLVDLNSGIFTTQTGTTLNLFEEQKQIQSAFAQKINNQLQKELEKQGIALQRPIEFKITERRPDNYFERLEPLAKVYDYTFENVTLKDTAVTGNFCIKAIIRGEKDDSIDWGHAQYDQEGNLVKPAEKPIRYVVNTLSLYVNAYDCSAKVQNTQTGIGLASYSPKLGDTRHWVVSIKVEK